jgi:hypothetical protein
VQDVAEKIAGRPMQTYAPTAKQEVTG